MSARVRNVAIAPLNLRAMHALAGRWKAGMLATDGRRWVRVKDCISYGFLEALGAGGTDFRADKGVGWAPDLDDAATVGAFHEVVWEALADVGRTVYWVSYGDAEVQIVAGRSEDAKETFAGRTYAAALVAVLEMERGPGSSMRS